MLSVPDVLLSQRGTTCKKKYRLPPPSRKYHTLTTTNACVYACTVLIFCQTVVQ